MGSMLRSDPMTLCDIYIQPEAAFEILSQLGEMGCVQFLDLNADLQLFQRSYVTEICRFAEMERKLRYFKAEMVTEKIKIPIPENIPKAMHLNEIFPYENMFDKWESDITEMTTNQTNLMKNCVEYIEMYYVLTTIGPLLGDTESTSMFGNLPMGGISDHLQGGQLVIITGVVSRYRCFPFEMMLWRISRGNIYYRQAYRDKIVQDPRTGRDIRKVAFLAICQGEVLKSRMLKVCSGFGVNLFPCPMDYNERIELIYQMEIAIADLKEVLLTTKIQRCKALRVIAKQWWSWWLQVKKSMAIYHNLNCFNFDITKKCLIGQCWVPDVDLRQVQLCLHNVSTEVGTNVPSFLSRTETTETPPTFHRTNKFTHGFQALINAYGVSTYKELNPGLYTIIMFPFLFSIMFGDLGHGLIVAIFGAWMVLSEKKYMNKMSDNEIWNIVFGGRYIILLLGLFSIYAGIIYNDIFSKKFRLNSSAWMTHIAKVFQNTEDIHYTEKEQLETTATWNLRPETSTAYFLGMEPLTAFAMNRIMIENSVKMKLSIIIGVIHMLFGTCLSLANYIYFKNYYCVYLRFLPEFIFMSCLFLYLVVLLYLKWFLYSAKNDPPKNNTCAPQILILFINMVLLKDTEPLYPGCEGYMFESQKYIQMVLLVIALLCVPVMLFGTPLYLHQYHKKRRLAAMNRSTKFRRYQRKDSDKIDSEAQAQAEIEKHTISFGELMITQGVHTIEYVLSTVSHTASYLRLWALSLAHSELSEMLWHMILANLSLKDHSFVGVVKIFLIFPVWAVFTIAVLVVMEGLSAFLHTLRLHWVEFMSKFYSGNGWQFKPFSFQSILDGEDKKLDLTCKPLAQVEY